VDVLCKKWICYVEDFNFERCKIHAVYLMDGSCPTSCNINTANHMSQLHQTFCFLCVHLSHAVN
jgi:hypothetical protein